MDPVPYNDTFFQTFFFPQIFVKSGCETEQVTEKFSPTLKDAAVLKFYQEGRSRLSFVFYQQELEALAF